ncbi:MAG: hypothetical protein GY730_02115 [bacterium]|nr:hypothetical protein [bacterium]
MNNKIILQSNVSCFQTYKAKLSNMSWNRGIANFFLADIPFSYSTGHVLASRIVDIIYNIDQFQGASKNKRIYEFGAGLAMLSKHILDILKKDHPELYKQTACHISDQSLPVISQIQKFNTHKDHQKNIFFSLMDAANPEFNTGKEPGIVILSYLLDSFKTRLIEIENGKLYEIRYDEFFLKNSKILDMSHFPPKIFDLQEVKKLLESGSNHLMNNIYRISRELREEEVRVPVDDVKNFEDGEKEELLDFTATLNINGRCRINYSYQAGKTLSLIIGKLLKESIILIHDLGITRPLLSNNNSKMYTPLVKFKSVICYPVFFPYLHYIARKADISSFLTSNKPGENQVCIFYKGEHVNKMKNLFRKLFINKDHNRISNKIHEIRQNKKDYLRKDKDLESFLPDLSEYDRKSYFLLVNLTNLFYEEKMYALALDYARKSLECYRPVAIPSYMLMGKIYIKLGNLDKAERCFIKILDICDSYPDAYNELGLIYFDNKDYERFIEVAKKYLKYCTIDNIWDHLIVMSIFYLTLEKNRECEKIVDWVLDLAKSHPVMVPFTVQLRIKDIKNRFFTKSIK